MMRRLSCYEVNSSTKIEKNKETTKKFFLTKFTRVSQVAKVLYNSPVGVTVQRQGLVRKDVAPACFCCPLWG